MWFTRYISQLGLVDKSNAKHRYMENNKLGQKISIRKLIYALSDASVLIELDKTKRVNDV